MPVESQTGVKSISLTPSISLKSRSSLSRTACTTTGRKVFPQSTCLTSIQLTTSCSPRTPPKLNTRSGRACRPQTRHNSMDCSRKRRHSSKTVDSLWIGITTTSTAFSRLRARSGRPSTRIIFEWSCKTWQVFLRMTMNTCNRQQLRRSWMTIR